MNVEEETGEHQSPSSLWARVRDWFATWTAVFQPHEILRDGLTRRLALRCCHWLGPLEATVRRLIIAAALALHPAQLAPAASRKTPRDPSDSDRPSPAPLAAAGFRIVSIHGAGAPRGKASVAVAASPAVRHLPFPADELLRLGGSAQRQGGKPASRGLNPLRRRGRIRSSDPDYAPESETGYADSSELLFGSPEDREPPPRRDSHARRYRVPAQQEDSEWRRIEKEWERVLPAPGIAVRITALARVLDAPERQIHRLARRLAADPDLAALLRGAPPPLLRKPKHDHFAPQVDEDLPMLAYAALRPPDTS